MPITYRECEYQYNFSEFLLCNCAKFGISKDEARNIYRALPNVEGTEDIAYIRKSDLKKIPISSEKREHFWSIVTLIQHDKDFQGYCRMLHAHGGDYDYKPPYYDYGPSTRSQPSEPREHGTRHGMGTRIEQTDLHTLLLRLQATV